uniref:Uncharacterized protein n=1 Tax=Oryza brachyantha TaxID=4533 RepID=J3NBP5_ORYBR
MASVPRLAAGVLLLALALADAAAFLAPVALGGELDGGGGLVECWGAMSELRSCTDEIVLFFLDGETTRLVFVLVSKRWSALCY